jgi:hypothetical protein
VSVERTVTGGGTRVVDGIVVEPVVVEVDGSTSTVDQTGVGGPDRAVMAPVRGTSGRAMRHHQRGR